MMRSLTIAISTVTISCLIGVALSVPVGNKQVGVEEGEHDFFDFSSLTDGEKLDILQTAIELRNISKSIKWPEYSNGVANFEEVETNDFEYEYYEYEHGFQTEDESEDEPEAEIDDDSDDYEEEQMNFAETTVPGKLRGEVTDETLSGHRQLGGYHMAMRMPRPMRSGGGKGRGKGKGKGKKGKSKGKGKGKGKKSKKKKGKGKKKKKGKGKKKKKGFAPYKPPAFAPFFAPATPFYAPTPRRTRRPTPRPTPKMQPPAPPMVSPPTMDLTPRPTFPLTLGPTFPGQTLQPTPSPTFGQVTSQPVEGPPVSPAPFDPGSGPNTPSPVVLGTNAPATAAPVVTVTAAPIVPTTPRPTFEPGTFRRCFPSDGPTVGCPNPDLAAICDKYNPLASFTQCYANCIIAFCCIHDSSSTRAPSCSQEPNCSFFDPCYIIWFQLHDTIGPAPYLRLNQNEAFYDINDDDFTQVIQNNPAFFDQLFGHHFQTDDLPLLDATFENPDNW